MREWKWLPKRRKAAKLIAEGALSYEEIAKECGVSTRALWAWRQVPEFQRYVQELEEAIRSEAKRYLHRRALHAARRLVELSEHGKPSDRVRLQATVEILNRSGVIPVKGVEVSGASPIVAVLPAPRDGVPAPRSDGVPAPRDETPAAPREEDDAGAVGSA